MVRISSDVSKRLQRDATCVRNICILAHVDHGKTSLSDSLLASNGIISQRLAGKVRFLDSRPDEQLRGITMESSAISLYFRVLHKQEGSSEPLVNEHLINLIDSPGHIDFSSEVSAASRLCDGAIVLVDVVEGVCSQTITVLRQCWTEKLRPILVLNKIDRLITELQLTPQEAYVHLSKTIEQVNSVLGSFFAGERLLDDLSWREKLEEDAQAEYVERDDADIYFDPSRNNVIFASATDGWGFNVSLFAKFYEQKLGAKRENLQKVLWGDFYMEPKTKKIINHKALKGRSLKPLFVSLILDNIWKIYENVLTTHDSAMLEKITKTLDIKVLPRDLRSKDYKNLLRVIMGQWMPVSTAILLTAVTELPSPKTSQDQKIASILATSPGGEDIDPALFNALTKCDSSGPVCAYVSKMLSIPKEELPLSAEEVSGTAAVIAQSKRIREEAQRAAELAESMAKLNTKTDDDLYARANDTVFTPDVDELDALPKPKKKLPINDDIQVVSELAPRLDLDVGYVSDTASIAEHDDAGHGMGSFVPTDIDPNDPLASMFEYEEEDPFALPEDEPLPVTVEENDDEVLIGFGRIYSGTLKVGQEVSVINPNYSPEDPENHITTTTITSLYLFMGKELVPLDECPAGNIVGIGGLAGKLLKNGTLLEKDVPGINLANSTAHSTPIVRVALEPTDPTQINQLVRGLTLLNQADPCVETYVEESGEHILCTAGELHLERCLKDLRERFAGIEITASEPVIPYRETFLKTPEMNPPKKPTLGRGRIELLLGNIKLQFRTFPLPTEVTEFLAAHEDTIRSMSENGAKGNACLTPQKFMDCLAKVLPDGSENAELRDLLKNICAFGPKRCGPNMLFSSNGLLSTYGEPEEGSFIYGESVINGFQLAMSGGPLAGEPVQGMAVLLEYAGDMTEAECEAISDPAYIRDLPDIAGRLITTARDTIHQACLDWSPRLMWAVYTCEIQTSIDVLGKVYAVVLQRRGRIISEELKEGTPFFQVVARIPVVEAFGFSEDIRKKTSGAAQPQLVFSGYEAIDMDPFWVPTTEEELEELGDTADRENIARRYMNNIRRRKGLFVHEKIVDKAEKQRTLKRN
ncbi:AaceriAFR031Cp [[Ashbya] aceris (nom. inval.)]|nr:AaceriAFR031Cp [[Ashbya] aceris (nom. inval.)]